MSEFSELRPSTETSGRRSKRIWDKNIDSLFRVVGLATTLLGLIVLAVLIMDVLMDGAKRLGWDFFMSYPSRKPEQAGILSAWVGTIWIMITTAILAIPLGVGSGIYLEEYARRNRLTDFIEITRQPH